MMIESYRGFAYPLQMDHVGHINVQFYTVRFDEATWHFSARFGLTRTFFRDNNRSMVAFEQRTQYKREVMAGTPPDLPGWPRQIRLVSGKVADSTRLLV